MKNICVITGSRSEYGLLKHLIKGLFKIKNFRTKLVVTGTHLSKEYGSTYEEIKKDGLKIFKKIYLDLSHDKKFDIANITSISILKFSNFFSKNRYDLIIILGDRYEIYGAAISAYFLNIPIAHFHGGETTQGAIDEGIRHSITKMSSFHFASTKNYKKRIIQLGEKKQNVFHVGSLALDNIKKTKLLQKYYLEKYLNFKFNGNLALFTYHPVTLERYTSKQQIKIILDALDEFKTLKIIFTQSNSDSDNKVINQEIIKYVKKNKNRTVFVNSLGSLKYYSSLKFVDFVIGNSSSGLIEVPYFKIPTINIGDRQKGRLKSKSVIDVDCNKNEIIKLIKKILDNKFSNKILNYKNPYYKEKTIQNSLKAIRNLDLNKNLKKKFYDIKF